MNGARAWLVFAGGTFAYLAAVTQRTSMGVATIDAAERFDATATGLAFFGMLQLAVYALLQVPVGMLIDRIGPRRLMLAGTIVVTLGQVVVALSPVLPLAVAGRVLVGAGDAALFVSVLRLLPNWFSGRRLLILPQWVATLGQAGQLLSAIPFAALLGLVGWTPAFLAAAAFAALAAVGVALAVRDRPAGVPAPARAGRGGGLATLREAARQPGTWLGFWAHFTSQPSATVFTLMWGYSFLVLGLGYDPTLAASLITLVIVTAIVSGPLVVGPLAARFPRRQSDIVLLVVGAIAAGWVAVLVWPGEPPLWLVVLQCVLMGLGGPASVIGFEFARLSNGPARLGSANGIVNVGGFAASVVMIFFIGVVIDAIQHALPAADAFEAYRWAMAVQIPVLVLGGTFVLITRRRTRRALGASPSA